MALYAPLVVGLELPAGAVAVKPWAGECIGPGCIVWRDALSGAEWVVYAPLTAARLAAA